MENEYPCIKSFYFDDTFIVLFTKPKCGFVIQAGLITRYHFMKYRDDWSEDDFEFIEEESNQ